MSFSRSAVGATLALGIVAAWMGACSSSTSVPCGVDGLQNGTCQSGPTCQAGSTEIFISNPFDMCPGSNAAGTGASICCAPSDAGGAVLGPDATTGAPDATNANDATVKSDSSPGPDGAHEASTDAMRTDGGHAETGTPEAGHAETGAGDAGSGDAHIADVVQPDGGHDGGLVCGGGAACATPADCPTSATLCTTATCSSGCCGTANASSGTVCMDNGGKVCDGAGTCVACLAATDCSAEPSTCATNTCDPTAHTCASTNAPLGTPCTGAVGSVVCDGNGSCVVMHCADGVMDADETDVDCGGSCGPTCKSSGPQQKCLVGGDCVDGVCSGTPLLCQPPSCTDGVKNGTETGVDCGGATCDALGDTCPIASACSANGDCQSGSCQGDVCALLSNGGTCTGAGQCLSGNCISGTCCDTACAGQCQACGANGICGSVIDGVTCNDGNACTQTDTCQNGTCTGSNSVVCTAEDQCHVAGTCDPTSGTCSDPTQPDGTSCTSGAACTLTPTCQAGSCTGNACASGLCGTSLSAFTGTQTSGWSFNGSAFYDATTGTAVLVDGSVTTGQAGTAIYQDPIVADSFSVSFDFLVTETNGRADGLVFVLETNGSTALGSGFGGFGVLGLTGYAAELDIFDSNSCDPGNGNHAGIDLLSPCTSSISGTTSGSNLGIPQPVAVSDDLYTSIGAGDNGVGDIGDGQWRTTTVTLVSGQLSVSTTDPTTSLPVVIPNLQNIPLPGFVPGTSYYFGFGGGSGSNGLASREEIRNVSVTFGSTHCL